MYQYFTKGRRLQAVIIAIVVMIGLPLLTFAYELSLEDSAAVKISMPNGPVFTVTDGKLGNMDVLPDSFPIDKIVIRYSDHSSNTLKITSGDTTILEKQVKNSLSSKEIKDALEKAESNNEQLVLYKAKKYSITHGGNEWPLSFGVIKQIKTNVTEKSDSIPKAGADSGNGNGNEDGKSWWNKVKDIFKAHLIITLIILLIVVMGFCAWRFKDKIKKIIKINKKDNSEKDHNPPQDQKDSNPKNPDSPAPSDTLGTSKAELESSLAKMKEEILSSIKDLNRNIDKVINRQSDDEIIAQAINNNRLTEKQKEKLLSKLIDRINNRLNSKQLSIKEKSLNAFVELIVDKIRHSSKNAQNESLKVVNNVLGCNLQQLDDSSLRKATDDALLKRLTKELPSLSKSNIDDVIGELKSFEKNNNDLNTLLNKFEAKSVDTLEDAIRKKEMSELESKNKELMSATQTMVDKLHSYAGNLEKEQPLSILSPCSDEHKNSCLDIEERLYNNLVQIAKGLKEFTISEDTKPADAKKRIQDKLVSIINEKDSAINTICRYYAYSRLPFMTDNTRKFGAIFNRRNMSVLYETINNLFVTFGISFDIPELFVMGVEERSDRYENLTGQGPCSRDLDYLCPNSCNHVDKIDTTNKPSNVIVDIVNVGYSIEGKMAKKTSVLTF